MVTVVKADKPKKLKKKKTVPSGATTFMTNELITDLSNICVAVFTESAPFIKYVKPILQGYSQVVLTIIKHALLAIVRLIDIVVIADGSAKQRLTAFNRAAAAVASSNPAVKDLVLPAFNALTSMR